jgi:hypothetical protein
MKIAVGTLIISSTGRFGIIISNIESYKISWNTGENTSCSESSMHMMIEHKKWYIEENK